MSTTSTVRISGASDDLVEIAGTHPICEEYGPTPIHGIESFRATLTGEGNEGAILHVQYTDPGVWMVGLAPYDEDYVIPERWEARYVLPDASESRYSAVLELKLDASDTLEVLDGRDPRKPEQD